MSLRIAKVTAFHPEAMAADITYLDTRAQAALVQIASTAASTNTGLVDLPAPSPQAKGSVKMTHDRDVYAVVGVVGRSSPVILGFLFPQVAECLFTSENFRVNRHASDFYEVIDGQANAEWSHPSGTYFRIAETPAHADLTGQDFDKRWKITKNTERAPHVHLAVANGGLVVADIDIDPAGNVTLSHKGSLTTSTGGNLQATVTGTAELDAMGQVTLKTPAKVLLDAPVVQITGVLQVNGNGSAGDVGTVHGTLRVTGGDVIADAIHLKTHVHGGVTPGGADTGQPAP
jgi:hypothetical protein